MLTEEAVREIRKLYTLNRELEGALADVLVLLRGRLREVAKDPSWQMAAALTSMKRELRDWNMTTKRWAR